MVRLMDTSVIYIFKFLFGSGMQHLIAGLQSLNLSATMIVIIGILFVSIPVVGLTLYWLTWRVSSLKPMSLSLKQIAFSLLAIGGLLFLADIIAQPFLNRSIYSKYHKALPLGTTFLTPDAMRISLPVTFAPFRSESKTVKNIPDVCIEKKPNIYFFVIETLRKDFLDTKTAPHLVQFEKENISLGASFSNANSTHLSWFAIFHSNLPFYWTSARDTWSQGSIPLRYLKKLGYKIHVKSAADLRYYNMDKLIFGAEKEAIDDFEEFGNLDPCHRDALAFSSLKKAVLENEREGHVYLVFLDSTHSEYSFPKDFPLSFEPIAKEIDYLTIGPKSPELEAVKNRYRNAIHYIDHLFGQFFAFMKEQNRDANAIMAITGDHGEEFFEDGALFHGTHLNKYQTFVPIFMKFPEEKYKIQTQSITHLDLFPTILHYLTGQMDFLSLFDGQSIFDPNHWPYRICVSQNGPDTPLEFAIEKNDFKLHARFISNSKLEVVHLNGPLGAEAFAPFQGAPKEVLSEKM